MPDRPRYHHGDLRAALVEAAVTAARAGGEQAVRLNQLAAQVGVSASAAYRHFPGGLEDLLVAVGDVGRQELAGHIERGTAAASTARGARAARARFRASGRAYVDYVTEQPGLFQVTCRHVPGPGSADPYALLEACLDDLVATGVLPAARRPLAPEAAWATVHGLAVLLAEGPWARLSPAQQRRLVDRTLDVVERGL